MDWIDLAQDMDKCRAAVNTIKKLRVAQMRGISWLAEELLTSQGLCCIELVNLLVS
jgi:hypothetical protein